MKRKISIALAIIMAVTAGCGGSSGSTSNGVKKSITKEEAEIKLHNKLEKLSSNVETVNYLDHRDLGDGKEVFDNLFNELPDAATEYPNTVNGNGQINIEVASSTEKSTNKDNDDALNEIAEKFNSQGFEVDGKTISVSITPISSGDAVDYIKTGKKVWDVYAPSNQYWGRVLESEGVTVNLETDRMAGNTAGLVFEKNAYKTFTDEYGEATIGTVVQAVKDGKLSFGYTNPYPSSTGLNFLIELLYSSDPANLLSETARQSLISFSKNIDLIAYSTIQMTQSARNGSVKAFVYEHQKFVNTPELKDYVFIPFGIRHDNPVYTIGNLDESKKQAVDKFLEYCLSDESQKIFTKKGFNQADFESFTGEAHDIDGMTILSAQRLWKSEKNQSEIMLIPIIDISGSMEGDINIIRETLYSLTESIGEQHHVGLVSYDTDVYVNLPVGRFDMKWKSYYRGALNTLRPGSATATNNALLVALDMALEYKESNPEVRPVLILMSDGAQNEGYDLKEIQDIISGLGITIHTIGYNQDLDTLKTIANINESVYISAQTDNVLYKLKSFFNAEL